MKMSHEQKIIQLFKKYKSTMKTTFILTLINNSGLTKDFNYAYWKETLKWNQLLNTTHLGPPNKTVLL